MLVVTEEERFVEVLAAVSVGGLRHFEVVTCLVVYKNVYIHKPGLGAFEVPVRVGCRVWA